MKDTHATLWWRPLRKKYRDKSKEIKDIKDDEDKKVSLIKNILKSISLIPDSLKQEVYIKKLSSVLSIDESSLFRSFSTIETGKKIQKAKTRNYSKNNVLKVETSKKENSSEYIYQLERQIISILLKYGAEEILFEDIILNKNEKGDIVESKKEIRSKVFEKIYLFSARRAFRLPYIHIGISSHRGKRTSPSNANMVAEQRLELPATVSGLTTMGLEDNPVVRTAPQQAVGPRDQNSQRPSPQNTESRVGWQEDMSIALDRTPPRNMMEARAAERASREY